MASPAQIVDAIKQLTQKAQALQQPSQSISVVNGPLIVIGQGPFPQIIMGLVDICSATTNTLSQMEGMPPVAAGDDSDAILDTYKDVSRFGGSPSSFAKCSASVRPGQSSDFQHLARQSWIVLNSAIHRSTDRGISSSG